MTDLIKRAERLDPILEVDFDTVLDFERNPRGAWMAKEEALLLIRDLIAALQAAPTAEQLRGWAEHLANGGRIGIAEKVLAAADRKEGK
jgi:hypothetical protein